MIEHVATEPLVGLFYVQQHIHNVVPILHEIKAKLVDIVIAQFVARSNG
jgi:hypothetical protein